MVEPRRAAPLGPFVPATLGPGPARPEEQDFSLVLGGPLYQLLRRAHLEDDAPAIVLRRLLVLAGLAWLPLLLLSLAEGRLTGAAAVPFLHDVEVHVRFLVALPLLVVAELVVHWRLRPVVGLFLARRLVPESEVPRFHAALASAFRLRNSVIAEVALLAFVYVVGIAVVWRSYISLDAATWYATPASDGRTLTWAGMWYALVSIPLFQFLLVRWYFRIAIWVRFLWQVSRIGLNLVPTHPDRAGGLGFLSGTIYAFAALAAAHGALLAGWLANQILYRGTPLTDFKVEIGAMVVLVLFLAVAPLLLFSQQLARCKREGNREYGTLAERYVRAFDAKWLRGGAAPSEELLGSGDIQSLADLGNGIAVIREMRTLPATRDDLVRLVGVTLAPIAPLLLTMMPLEELLHRIFGILF